MAVFPIPLGDQGLYGGHGISRIPSEYLLKAENIAFDDGCIRKEGGATIYNDPLAVSFAEQANAKNIALNAVAWGNNTYVAVGAADGTDSYILTSANGSTWTERAPTVAKNLGLNDVTISHAADIFLAVGVADGTDAYILTSPTGVTWTERANPKNFALNGVAANASIHVAVGGADGTDAYIVTTSDIINWTEQANPKNIALNAVIWIQSLSLFVAVGAADGTDSYILTSPDGVTWTERAPTVAKNIGLNDLEWNGSLIVAVGDADGSDGYVLTSPDGTTWTERSNSKNFGLNNVIWASNLFYAGGVADGADAYLIVSDDGINWYEIENPKNFAINGFAFNGFDIVFVGAADGTDAYIGAKFQTSGRSEKTNPKAFDLNAVAFSGEVYVAVGDADGTNAYIVTSEDASTWTERSNPKNFNLNGLVSGGGKFVAVGDSDGSDSYIITSLDGVTWTERSNPSTAGLNSVDYNGLLYVAVGNAGATDAYIITSPDGVNWTERSNPKNFNLFCVKWISFLKLWIAVGANDGTDAYLITSPDGENWTERSNISSLFRAIESDGSTVIIFGFDAIRSTDGITWTQIISPLEITDGYNDIVWNGKVFVVTSNDSILVSYDGLIWIRYLDSGASSNSILWDGAKFLMVGDDVGGDAYIATLDFSPLYFLGAAYWNYDGATPKIVALDTAGRILMDDYDGTFDVVVKSGMTVTANTFPVFVEGGKEVAANNRKLFIFTGANIVQVISGSAVTTANLATPPADWTGATQPTGGLIHDNRLWGYGNSNDPHRLYYTGTANHEDFTAATAGSVPVYPGHGEKIVNAISYKGYVIVFKYPKGIYLVDTTSVQTANWKVNKINENLGGAGQGSASVVEEDLLFIDHAGEIRTLSGISEYGDIGSRSISDLHDISVFIRDNYYLPSNTKWRMQYYSKKRELHIGASSNSLGINDNRMVIDFNRQIPRFRNSTRDNCLFLFTRELNGVPELMSCDNSNIWRLDQLSKNKDGQGYVSQFQTMYTDLGVSYLDKNTSSLQVDFEPTSDVDVAIDVIWDGIYQETTTINIDRPDNAQPGRVALTKSVPLIGCGVRLSLIFRNNNADEDFALQGLRIIHDNAGLPDES